MSASLLMDFAEDFKLKGKLAEGGGGVVYKADLLNKDVVARFDTTMAVVKVLKRTRFLRLRLNHDLYLA